MRLITTTEELASACAELASHPFIAVDTEFMREQTFWPKLCLIQIAAGEHELLIDTLAPDIDLAPFFDLMNDESVLKVFHSARQDVEIMHHLAGQVPHPIFDTQVAAMVCGFGESVGYGMLVKRMLNRNLDKTSRFTDWSRRPLSEKQLTYAIGDVTHLRDLFPTLKSQLDDSGRETWLDEEMGVLTDPETYEQPPENAWKRLKMRTKTPKALAVLMEVAAWREREAQSQDVPRSRILKDDALHDIANQAPRSLDDLGALRSIHNGFVRSSRGRSVLEAVERGLERDLETVPRIQRNDPMTPESAAVFDLLRVLLKATAGHHGVAPKLIATSDELEQIARHDEPDLPTMKGWRRMLFGEQAMKLKRGELSLAVQNGEVSVLQVNGDDSSD
ncbi:Ribonuclease D [Methyloligella halotolerans]|uniref:Ribonuclease D n=1 Tax=Methyloligella halotolerans TaxID=1177755 RepID=A0A1E2RW44_9HYPH|nr:ribonuclease D [Methyloligella halotolerans]ODA66454.1 Ribonuclease D [Methyloligella halotolerans]